MKRSAAFIFSFLLVFSSSAFPQNPQVKIASAASKNAPLPSTKAVTAEDIERNMAEALTLIQDHHVNGAKLNYNELFKSSIGGMLNQLDPHSGYYDAKEFEQFRTDQSSQYFGIGATIDDLKLGDELSTYIKATFEDSPAHRAGLRYGDRILEVNGVSMIGKQFSEVRSYLRGPRGTVAKIIIERYGSKKREAVDIVRDAVAQPSIPEAYMVRPGVGYIAMTGGFNQTTGAEFKEALSTLKSQGMQNLVLDIRNNGGGLVREAYAVANTFLAAGQVVFTQKGRAAGPSDPIEARNPNPDQTPIVMLVNRNSASASEILAGALQDHDRALIVGENTFGKALVMNPFQLDYGSMLMLVIAKYETPSGRLIQRDYSDGSIYSYRFGNPDDKGPQAAPKGNESKTDSGRAVFGGNGISPDVVVKPRTITNERFLAQQKLSDSLLAFSMDLAFGKVSGYESLKIDRPIQFGYDIKPSEFIVNEALYQTYKQYAIQKFKLSGAQIDKEREFVERSIRSELATASYGSQTSFQVFNEYDDQLLKAIELLPRAKELALAGAKASAEKTKNK